MLEDCHLWYNQSLLHSVSHRVTPRCSACVSVSLGKSRGVGMGEEIIVEKLSNHTTSGLCCYFIISSIFSALILTIRTIFGRTIGLLFGFRDVYTI